MLIVLPPSETKAVGGLDRAMNVSFPTLDPVRERLLDELEHTRVDAPVSKQHEAEENFKLRSAPVMPAIRRYTGVLYDALDAPSLPAAAMERLAIGSALFGVLRADDLIPRYRLSGGSKLADKTMKAWWGSLVSDVLAEQGFVVDLRSGAYQQLGPAPHAVTVRVEDAVTGKVVSHFNKKYKGLLARDLSQAAEVDAVRDADGVADLARAAGHNALVSGNVVTLRV